MVFDFYFDGVTVKTGNTSMCNPQESIENSTQQRERNIPDKLPDVPAVFFFFFLEWYSIQMLTFLKPGILLYVRQIWRVSPCMFAFLLSRGEHACHVSPKRLTRGHPHFRHFALRVHASMNRFLKCFLLHFFIRRSSPSKLY